MDSRILSKQLEKLPASGLAVEIKSPSTSIGGFGVYLRYVFILFFILVLVSFQLLPFFSSHLWGSVVISTLFVGYCYHILKKYFLLTHPYAIKKIIFTELEWCYVQLNNTQVFKADIESDTILTEHLVILNLKEQESTFERTNLSTYFFGHHAIFLTADRLGNEKFRQVKRYLRFINFAKIEVV